MIIVNTIQGMRQACAEERVAARRLSEKRIRTLALVPTMGALHAGHLSLIRAARQECDVVAVSIFVNPTQFGPNEDFARYPRTLEEDCALLDRENVDLVFVPGVEEIYPKTSTATYIEVPAIGERLDGRTRPGHFRGVATVVAKLLHIVVPDAAFFGQKDAAQVAVLRAMVHDLNFATRMIVCPTVRETDGLALSSRNQYLTPEQRATAPVLYRSLQSVRSAAASGFDDVAHLRQAMLNILEHAENVRIDYAEIVNPETLEPVNDLRKGALVAVAAFFGETRLIDNIVLPPKR